MLIGIERIFAIVEKMAKESNLLQTPTVEVYICIYRFYTPMRLYILYVYIVYLHISI